LPNESEFLKMANLKNFSEIVQQLIASSEINVSVIDLSNEEHRKTYYEIIERNPDIPFDYSLDWYDYFVCQYLSTHTEFLIYVFVFSIGDQILCFWPLLIEQDSESLRIGSLNHPVRMPINIDLSDHHFSTVYNAIFYTCQRIGKYSTKGTIHFEHRELKYSNKWNWLTLISSKATEGFVRAEMTVDLNLPLDEIRNRIRKSYRSMIQLRNNELKLSVIDNDELGLWSECRDFHISYVGRQTRSDETWKIQSECARMGRAFIVRVTNEKDELCGFGLFCHNQFECVYSTGVYDRLGSGVGLGHVVQWAAIQEMKNRELKRYTVGVKNFDNDLAFPSEKEKSISYFKEGFATHILPRYILMYQNK
jgi:FemAB family protein